MLIIPFGTLEMTNSIFMTDSGSSVCNASFKNFSTISCWGCSWPGKALALLLGCAVYYDDSFCTALYICYLQADDIRNEANELLRIRDYLYNELAKNTGQPIEKVPPFVFFIL